MKENTDTEINWDNVTTCKQCARMYLPAHGHVCEMVEGKDYAKKYKAKNFR